MEFVLRERTIVIFGPLNTVTQSLLTGLTGQGADVALVHAEAQKAEKFCAQLTDQREIQTKHGRAAAIKTDTSTFLNVKDAFGRVVQSFGGIDVFIDANLTNTPTPLNFESAEINFDTMINDNLKTTLMATQAILGFLKNRKKGRIVYLMNKAAQSQAPEDAIQSACRSGLVAFTQALAKQVQEHSMTVNVLSLGMTEEFLLGHYEGLAIREALEKYKIQNPYARITEPEKITNSLIYLLSPSGAAINGQCIGVN